MLCPTQIYSDVALTATSGGKKWTVYNLFNFMITYHHTTLVLCCISFFCVCYHTANSDVVLTSCLSGLVSLQFDLNVCRCCRFVPRTCEQTSASTSTGRFLKNTQPFGWPVTAACGPSPWSSRPYTVRQVTSFTMLERAWTASALWCRDHLRSSRMMRWWPF